MNNCGNPKHGEKYVCSCCGLCSRCPPVVLLDGFSMAQIGEACYEYSNEAKNDLNSSQKKRRKSGSQALSKEQYEEAMPEDASCWASHTIPRAIKTQHKEYYNWILEKRDAYNQSAKKSTERKKAAVSYQEVTEVPGLLELKLKLKKCKRPKMSLLLINFTSCLNFLKLIVWPRHTVIPSKQSLTTTSGLLS